ncbi:MAG: LapA family protein [Spirochaetes bacterium]|nr:LapA family protein [Spirochaetota bacterium]MBX3721601.1 LapA family protein [Turneriella sp.]
MQRLNALAIAAVLIILLLLLNSHKVQIQIFFVNASLPLGGIMAACIALGVALSFLFLSLGRSYKKLLHRVKKTSHRPSATPD